MAPTPARGREARRVRIQRPLPRALLLLLLAVVAVLVDGYHYGTDDGAIYIPAVERFVHPSLFPYGAAFFESHGRISIFSKVVGAVVLGLHIPVPWAVLGFHLFGIWLLLVAGFWLATLCLRSGRAQWAAVLTLASVLTVPVAGTALPIMDPYLTARSLSTPVTLFAVTAMLAGRPVTAALLLVLTALLHPQMAVFGLVVAVLLTLPRPAATAVPAEGALAGAAGMITRLPAGFHLGAAQGAYRETLYSRSFFFAWAWTWYEWLGALLPFALLFAMVRLRPPGLTGSALRLCRALLVLAFLSTVAFVLFGSSSYFDDFVRLQPMRCFHLVYIVMFLLLGGLAGEFLLRDRPWRWIALFLPLAVVLYAVDRTTYPASQHLELPGRATSNPWVAAFRWVRANTPADAVFALPPRYILLPGEDFHGFRAIAQRSMLADAVKDSGVASVFPQMAAAWQRDQQFTQDWPRHTAADFRALPRRSPATWAVIERPQSGSLDCPYRNQAVSVCRLTP